MFASKQEAQNFKKSILETWLYKWLDRSEWEGSENSAEVPFFGDVINPRTKLKGYKGEWTDDDFYKYFEIDENEKKLWSLFSMLADFPTMTLGEAITYWKKN